MATLRLIRHATLLLELGNTTFLVDPMLDPAQARPPVPDTPNDRRNPLVDLPEPAADVVAAADAVIVTHLHADHLDDTAAELLARSGLPVFCQPGDEGTLRERGLADVTPVLDRAERGAIRLHRTGGRHGHGETADMLAPVSGFVFRAPNEPVVYIAGDTVWCSEVDAALAEHRPDVIVVNAGGAVFVGSEPIVMDAADVMRVAAAAPGAQVVAVHLDAINHCVEGRDALRAATEGITVPDDGASVPIG